MKRFFHMAFYYLIISPLSWLGIRRIQRLEWDLRNRLWPERSAILMSYRGDAITTMMELGYSIQSRGDTLIAFDFQKEFVLAQDSDLTERWRKAMVEAHRLRKERHGS